MEKPVLERWAGKDKRNGKSWWALVKKSCHLPDTNRLRQLLAEAGIENVEFDGPFSFGIYIGMPTGLPKKRRDQFMELLHTEVSS